MLSRNQQKLLRKLRQRKHRWAEGLFVAEGEKVVRELLEAEVPCRHLFVGDTAEWQHPEAELVPAAELRQWSQLEQSEGPIGVFSFPQWPRPERYPLVVVADGLRDPGNLGTLIRTCDWFGVRQVFATPGTTDVFNAKCVQASMGSIARVAVRYLEPGAIVQQLGPEYHWLRADLEGTPLPEYELKPHTALVLGSESHGPQEYWRQYAPAVRIPHFGDSPTESLNVSASAAILLYAFCAGS